MLSATRLADVLTDRYGVPLLGEARDDADGQRAEFRPRDLARTQGFTVGVQIGWKTVDVEFTLAAYAKQLLAAMSQADAGQRATFRAFIESAVSHGASVRFQINHQNVDPLQPHTWPAVWDSLAMSLSRGPMQIDGANPDAIEALVIAWGGRMLGSVLALIPLEPVQPQPHGEAEGGAYQELVTKYERSQINRAACIEIHGCLCKACDFDFERVYGPTGRGFIEVHHVEMVARLAAGTFLDPAIDLVPLCSNCHSIAHRRKDLPYSVAELKAMLIAAETKAAQGG